VERSSIGHGCRVEVGQGLLPMSYGKSRPSLRMEIYKKQSACKINAWPSKQFITTRLAFLAVVDPLYTSSKSALLASVTYFIGEFNIAVSLPSDRIVDNQGPQITARLTLLTQNEDIVLNLRTFDGRRSNPVFDLFWAKAVFF